MRYSELKRQLKKEGCYKTGEGSRHEEWYSPKTGKTFPVGRHDQEEVATGTLRNIRRDSGIRG